MAKKKFATVTTRLLPSIRNQIGKPQQMTKKNKGKKNPHTNWRDYKEKRQKQEDSKE